MTAGIFADCVFFLKLNNLSFKEKKHLKRSISSHGGSFSFVLNDKCTHVIASNASSLGSTHLKKIHKHHISLVNLEFIWKCIEEKQLLKEASDFEKPVDVILEKVKSVERKEASRYVRSMKNLRPVTNLPDTRDDIFDREYTVEEMKEVEPTSSEDTEVAKYCFLQKDREVAVLELLCHKENHSFPFKISTSSGPLDGLQKEHSFYLAKDSEKACERYAWRINDLKNKGFLQKDDAPSQAIPFASDALQKVLLEETINTGTISREVGYFVESIWTDAQGHLSNILSCPVNNISINDVGVAEGILLQMKTSLAAQESARQMGVMMCEFYRLIPHITVSTQEITMELLTKKQELCQLIRDMLNVCETTPSSRYPSSLAKYRALRCRIELLDKNAEEFVRVSKQILQKNYSNEPIEILNIYQIGRLSETCDFDGKLENVQPLLHATSPRNFVGILSRGLLMPKIITEEMGYNRTDVGNLGSGIYFTDSISTSVKYSEPSSTSGSRLLVVCDVALGKSRKVHKKDYTITEPPEGFHSVHGVRRAPGIESDFEDDEFVVYKGNQIKMAYAVQFRTSRDIVVNLQPNVLSVELEETPEDSDEGLNPLDGSVIDDMCNENNIKGGLQNTQGEQIPLEKIYVKAKLMDLVAQVTLFQIYKNSSANPIEAKYVFPLDSTAAVCGFEAFINGKHIVGEVKEKQQARQEYRSAIKEGHGAYLMDQDAPDAFTVSVGNLPPKATVVIKITYIMEVKLSYGSLDFKIPGAVASWQKDTAIKENTQDTVTKVGIDKDGVPEGCFSLEMSVEVPYKINSLFAFNHDILTKKTDCKAVIKTADGSSFGELGFHLLINMETPSAPRMWVEKHPEKDSEACMLVFQPEFSDSSEAGDVTIFLDCSNSMKPCFQNAQLLALRMASQFSDGESNIVLFGSSFKEFEFYPKRCYSKRSEELETFIKMAKPNMGGTEFWKPLHSLGLLSRKSGIHDIVLISDGHLQNERHIIQFLKNNVGKIRLFTCGVGATANRHSLRRLARLGHGTFDFFDTKTKSRWKDQLDSLDKRLLHKACTSVSVKWTRHNRPDVELSQAPAKLPPVFSDDQLLVYGFIRHCTQATLKGLIEDKEMETMVSTTELQKTTGTILHKLTARALIRDYEDGILHEEDDENEMQKQLRKSEIINISKEYSIVTQFTSFIAVEKRDADEQQDVEPNILEIISAEDVDFLPYMTWEDKSDEEVKNERASRIGKSDDLAMSDEDFYEIGSALYEDSESQSRPILLMEPFGDACFDEEVKNERASRISKSDDLAMSDEDFYEIGSALYEDSESQSRPIQLMEPFGDACFESRKRDHDESYYSPTSYDDAHPVEHSEVEDHQETLMELDAHHDETVLYECADTFPISPQEDLKATRFLKKKKKSIKPSAVSAPPPPLTSAASLKPPPGATGMELGWTPPPPPPVAAEEQVFLPLGSFESHRPLFKKGTLNVQEDPLLFSQGYALRLPAAPPAPMGFGSSAGAILGPKPSKQAIRHEKKSSQTLDSDLACSYQSISYSQIQPEPIVYETEVQHIWTPSYPPLSPSFRPSAPPQRHGAALFGSSAGGLSRETGLQRDRMLSQTSIFSRSMSSPPPLFIQEQPSGGPPQAALKEDERFLRGFGMRLRGRSEIPAAKRTPPSWAALSALQTKEGFWMLTPELGNILSIDVPFLIDDFLMKNGIVSLGSRGKDDVCGLIATLLVLQAIRLLNLVNSINFKSLLKLDESSCTSEYCQNIENAIKWARKVEQQYPGICVRLGLGKDWDFVTKQLLDSNRWNGLLNFGQLWISEDV